MQETIAGLRFVFGHPLLRPLACFSVTTYFFFGFIGPLYVLYAIRELRLPPAALGVAIALGGVGAMLGASFAPADRAPLGPGTDVHRRRSRSAWRRTRCFHWRMVRWRWPWHS